jgi:hypothetical protein
MAAKESKEASAKRRQGIMSRVVVKAWTDPDFARRLQEKPLDVLAEEGLELEEPRAVNVVVHIDTPQTKHIVIPVPPDLLSLPEEQLLMIAAQHLSIQLELF